MEVQKLKAILITVTLIGIGIGLSVFGWSRVRTDRLLDQSSVATEGRVVDSRVYKGSRGGQWPTLVVEYTPAGQAAITRDFDVDSSTYQKALETGKVTVSYWPGDPRIGRVTRFTVLPFQLLTGLGVLILLAGLLCLHHFRKGTGMGPAGDS